MHSLPLFVRLQGRPVILLGEGDAADAKRRLLERAGARMVGEETQAQLAIVAIDDEAEAVAAVARLKARNILVNAVDRPALCDFTLPAIVDRDPVLVAIGTGGASAGLAKAVRQRIEALLPASLGSLARAFHAARPKIKARWPDAADRRRALDAAMAAGGALDPMRNGADGDMLRWLDAPDRPVATGLHHFILASADPDDLTIGLARLLGEADIIYYRSDVPPSIVDRARADAVRIVAHIPPVDPGAGLAIWLEMRARR